MRSVGWSGFVLLIACVPAAAQPNVPQGAAGYYGSGVNLPFNEKALFPGNGPVHPSPATELPPTLIPDGSLPPPPPPKRWTGGFELGLNGSQGNADVLNLRLGLNAAQTTLSAIAQLAGATVRK